jgi:hypothetical protein
MLVVMMDNQLLSPNAICQNCLLANQQGQPRWNHGQLRCGRRLSQIQEGQPDQYECQMGFRIANIE